MFVNPKATHQDARKGTHPLGWDDKLGRWLKRVKLVLAILSWTLQRKSLVCPASRYGTGHTGVACLTAGITCSPNA